MMSVKILDITKVHQIRMSCKYIRCYKGASDHDVLYTDPDSLLDQTNQMLAFNVVILDLEYIHICDRQSVTLCARQISVYEVLCSTLCLYGCLYGCIFFVYYVCIT